MVATTSSKTLQYHKSLSVQVSLTGLSFFVRAPDGVSQVTKKDIKVSQPSELLDALSDFFTEKSISVKDFDQLTVIHKNDWSSFVPKAFFKEAHLADYLKFNVALMPTDFISYDIINNNDMVNVYLPFVNINNFFIDAFGTFQYKHHATVLVENILNKEAGMQREQVYLHFDHHQFECVAVKNGKLQLYNQFAYTTAEDVLYFTLFCMQRIHFNADYGLILLGDFSGKDELIDLIKVYLPVDSDVINNRQTDTENTKNFILMHA
ncbi:MAG: DUF3822 family protein [Bacteroidetes bacterium]|nr:DUF3822 family protein [Bacteroidota bacterium]